MNLTISIIIPPKASLTIITSLYVGVCDTLLQERHKKNSLLSLSHYFPPSSSPYHHSFVCYFTVTVCREGGYQMFLLNLVYVSILNAVSVSGSSCTDTCDLSYGTGIPITMCGTDMVTHHTYFDALCSTSSCYKDQCSVMTYYPGPCGCPNNCFEASKQGQCSGDGMCVCEKGWTGKDCSLVAYENLCSYHGKLIPRGSEDSEFEFDYCLCDDGFTGIDCSSPVFSSGTLPWGNVFDGEEYTKEDKYGDDHPVWNTSLIATIRCVCMLFSCSTWPVVYLIR
jgi:hypothetical protein